MADISSFLGHSEDEGKHIKVKGKQQHKQLLQVNTDILLLQAVRFVWQQKLLYLLHRGLALLISTNLMRAYVFYKYEICLTKYFF